MPEASGSFRASDDCRLPDDTTADLELPESCSSSTGVALSCERDLVVQMMPESNVGGVVADTYLPTKRTTFSSQIEFDGLVFARVRDGRYHRVCVAESDIVGDAG